LVCIFRATYSGKSYSNTYETVGLKLEKKRDVLLSVLVWKHWKHWKQVCRTHK
jgi:hypothetical protein